MRAMTAAGGRPRGMTFAGLRPQTADEHRETGRLLRWERSDRVVFGLRWDVVTEYSPGCPPSVVFPKEPQSCEFTSQT